MLDPDDRAKRCDLLLAQSFAQRPAGEPRRATDYAVTRSLALAEALKNHDRAALAYTLATWALNSLHRGEIASSP